MRSLGTGQNSFAIESVIDRMDRVFPALLTVVFAHASGCDFRFLKERARRVIKPRSKRLGCVEWMDLTVENAGEVRDFYGRVAGWSKLELPVEDYDDFCVGPDEKNVLAGICDACGPNADIPPEWRIYINVDDLDASLKAVQDNGGGIKYAIRRAGAARFCMIADSAGVICTLFEPKPDAE